MSEGRFKSLLIAWKEQHLRGRDVPAAQLCHDCPELAEELDRRIGVLRQLYGPAPPGDATLGQPPPATVRMPPISKCQTRIVNEGVTESAGPAGMSSSKAGPLPESIPGYEILGELGRGGMGVVYKARQISLNRVVALKMILAGSHAGTEALARFLHEAETIARLKHPHVVQVHEFGTHEGKPFFSLEYLEGGSLAGQLKGEPQAPAQAARMVRTLAIAVQAAHEQGVVHRDLKPANVLLAADGTPKITDFGVAKQGDSGMTATGDVLGTPGYMAPEQAMGGTKAAGPAADVYALGAILYEQLTGRPPFKGASAWDTLQMVTTTEPVAPSQLQPRVPRELETVCLKCLEKEPHKRYPTALALAEDLRRYLEHEPILARPVGVLGRGWRWCVRNPSLACVSGLAAGGLVAATLVSLLLAIHQADSASRLAEVAEALADKQAQTEAALWTARRQSSLLSLERGLTSCDQGEEAVGLLWFARSLREAPDGTSDLQRAIRGCLSNTARRLHPLAAVCSHQGIINALAFSPDRRLLVTGSSDRTAQLWEVGTGKRYGPALPHPGRIWAVAFSPDGKSLLTGCEDKTARLWDVHSGKPLELSLVHRGEVRAVAFSPDGQLLLTGSTDKTARLWHRATGQAAGVPLPHQDVVKAVAFSPDGTRILTGSWDGTAQQWDARTCKPLGSPLQHRNWVNAVAFSHDGKTLVTGSDDHTARLWEAATGKPVGEPLPHNGGVFAAVFSPDSRYVLTGSGDHNARLWEARTGRLAGVPLFHPAFVRAVAFSANGRSLATGCDDQAARVWEAPVTDSARYTLQHGGGVYGVMFSPEGATLLTGSGDLAIQRWASATGQALGAPLQLSKAIEILFLGPDGKTILAGYKDRTAQLLDAVAGKPVAAPVSLPEVLHAAAFSPDGSTILLACEDGSVSRWRPNSSEPLQPILRRPELVHALALSPDGRSFATGGEDHTAHIWDAVTGASLGPPLKHQGEVYGVAFSPDARTLVSGSGDRTAKFWDPTTGQALGMPLKHGDAVWAVAFSPDGKTVLTGSGDKTVRLWDVASCQPLAPPFRHQDDVRAVTFSSNGRTVLSGSLDQTARLWDVHPPAEGDADDITLWTSVLTGMDLGEDNVLRSLDAQTWAERRRRLFDERSLPRIEQRLKTRDVE